MVGGNEGCAERSAHTCRGKSSRPAQIHEGSKFTSLLGRDWAHNGKLDATYASLGGNAVGCTEFLGITFRIRSDSNVPADQPAHQGAVKSVDRQLYLVFERASRGTARECLVEEVKDASFIKSWDVTANALNSICNGLVTLHEHGVVHRWVIFHFRNAFDNNGLLNYLS